MKLLYTFILVFSFSVLFTSCGKNEDTKPTTETTKEENKEPEKRNEKAPEATGEKIGKLEVLKFDRNDIPADIKYKGRVMGGGRWKDLNGENILIITETEIQNGKDKDGESVISKELYGYCYARTNAESNLLWQINDFVKDCEFDLFLNYNPNSLTITDLDDNGIAESTFLYRMSCKSDVSPDEMKLMMHQGKDKYALRGENQIKFTTDGQTVTQGGDYKVDASFDKAPKEFLEYAKKQWAKFKIQELN